MLLLILLPTFTTTTTSATSTTISIATTCKAKSIRKKSQKHINIQVIKRIYQLGRSND